MIKYWDYLREYKKLKREILNSVNKVFESGTLLFGEELKKFAHGYSSLAKENIVVYFLSEDWHPSQESGIIWNDKFLNINWGIKKPILSKKDKLLKPFLKL